MDDLTQLKCVPCRGGELPLTATEVATLKKHILEWDIVELEGIKRLRRVYKFRDFAEALAFINKVGEIAEDEDHHPALLTEWGKVTVNWWTHVVKGLHKNDFIMAAKTDVL